MKKSKSILANKDEAAPIEHPQKANDLHRIKSQVLAKIGKPPRLDRVEVSRHHGTTAPSTVLTSGSGLSRIGTSP